MTTRDTIAAIATAPGRAGIGVVRVSGPRLAVFAEALTGLRLTPRRATFASFRDADATVIDQGIALFFESPQSYTGEDVLELHGHGGPVVLRLLLERCVKLGARVADPGEFTRRAFLNGKLDLAQAESVIDLIEAATSQAARCAVRSLRGDFSARIQELARSLVDLRARVEATLDFPEEEIGSSHLSDLRQRLQHIQSAISEVQRSARQGALLRDGLHIVLAGQPNVGKSSLLNRLAGEDLAIVTEVPGTTRDLVRQAIDIDGIPAYITDTAGLRDAADAVERLGIERAWQAIAEADVFVLVLEAARGMTAEDEAIVNRVAPRLRQVRVMNKVDLLGAAPVLKRYAHDTEVWLSAKTGEGIDLLRDALCEAAGWEGPSETLFLARERHTVALRNAAEHLTHAIDYPNSPELFAEELRLAHEQLNLITGEYGADDLLGEIFSRFCIGK